MALLKPYVAAGAALGLGLLATVAVANQRLERAAADIPYLPVLTNTQTVGETISACMYHGAAPQQFRVVHTSCRVGATQCTAFVALRSARDQTLVVGFDLTNPPVEASGSTCDRPVAVRSGVLQPRDASSGAAHTRR